MADELGEILPTLTKKAIQPATEQNGVQHDDVQFEAVNYISILPFTVKAIQEQQVIIEEKEERISKLEEEMREMKEQLALLMEKSNRVPTTDVTVGFAHNSAGTEGTKLHQNRPNPFRQLTTFTYTLGNGGSVDLSIYSMEGVFIETVISGSQEKGEHKVEWDSKDVPNGMYFYILTVDGVEWVKKAIRLQ